MARSLVTETYTSKSRARRIFFVLPVLEPAGMEVMALSLAGELTSRGHQVTIVCTRDRGSLAAAAEDCGVRVLVEAPHRPLSSLFPTVLRRLLDRGTPDIVHIHGAPWLKAAIAARSAKVPTIVHTLHGLHTSHQRWHEIGMRAGALLTDLTITVSEQLRDYATERLRVSPSRLCVVSNGVDVTRFSTVSTGILRKQLGLADSVPLVGVVARFDPVKDHLTLLRAFSLVLRHLPDAHLALIGTGETLDLSRRFAQDANIGRSVHFLGARSDVRLLLPDLDILALSSRAEGLPMSILEGMASARAIVATAVGGIPQALAAGGGIIVPPGDAVRLAEAMCHALSDPARRRELGMRARDIAISSYSLSAMTDSYLRAYDLAGQLRRQHWWLSR